MESKNTTRADALQYIEAARTMLPTYRESTAKGRLTAAYLQHLSKDLRTLFEGLLESRTYIMNEGEGAAEVLQSIGRARELAEALATELSGRTVDDGQHPDQATQALLLCKTTAKAIAHLCRDALQYNRDEKAAAAYKQTPPTTADNVWTPRARTYLQRAMHAGYISQDGEGLHWNGRNVALAYFLGKAYGITERIPFKALEKLFGVKNLAKSSYNTKDAKTEQPWKVKIDELFVD